jgi:hypothetical protein
MVMSLSSAPARDLIAKFLTKPTIEWSWLDENALRTFGFWQFEKHLSAASDLIDRALQARHEYRELLTAAISVKHAKESDELKLEGDRAVHTENKQKVGGVERDVSAVAFELTKHQHFPSSAIEGSYNHLQGALSRANEMARKSGKGWTFGIDSISDYQTGAEANRQHAFRVQWDAEQQLRGFEEQLLVKEVEHQRKSFNLFETQFNERKKHFDSMKFDEEIIATQALIKRDLFEASMRLYAASVGMTRILGYSPVKIDFGDDLSAAVLKAAKQARLLILELALITENDQSFSISISLKKHLGADFERLLQGESVDFWIASEIIEQFDLVRFRSISASYWGGSRLALAMRVSLPKLAERSDGSKIDQSTVPSIYLGRVLPQESNQPTELAGGVSCMNASPIGSGSSVCSVQLLTKIAKSDIEDLELSLNLVGVPKG